MEKGTYYVYILRCRDGSLYTGLTNDLPRRWALHVSGRGAKYTRAHPPEALAALWQAEDHAAAARLEALIKRLPRSRKLALIAAPAEVEKVFGEKLKDSKYSPLAQEMLSLSFK